MTFVVQNRDFGDRPRFRMLCLGVKACGALSHVAAI